MPPTQLLAYAVVLLCPLRQISLRLEGIIIIRSPKEMGPQCLKQKNKLDSYILRLRVCISVKYESLGTLTVSAAGCGTGM